MITLTFSMGATLDVPAQCVLEQPEQGPCDEHVEYWVSRVDWSQITPGEIRTELAEYGAWDAEELADDDENRQRLLWVGSGSWQEDAFSDDRTV
jgi:hypothetical protein